MFKNPRWLVATGLMAALIPMSTLASDLPAPTGVACSYDGETASITWVDDAGPRYAAEFEAVYVYDGYAVEVTYKVELDSPYDIAGAAEAPAVLMQDVDGDEIEDELALDSLTGKVKSLSDTPRKGQKHPQNNAFATANCLEEI